MGKQASTILEMLLDGKEKESLVKENITFYQQTRNKLTYHSGVLEGIRLKEKQVELIGENAAVNLYGSEPVTIDDIDETKNHMKCFQYILDHVGEVITKEFIRTLHSMIKANTHSGARENIGSYKTKENPIGNMATTAPEQVETELSKLLEDYNQKEEIYIEDIFHFHSDFILISPFLDANGRIARMLMFKECLKYNITPFIIEDVHKSIYFRIIRDSREYVDLAMDLCLQEQKKYKVLVDLYKKKKW